MIFLVYGFKTIVYGFDTVWDVLTINNANKTGKPNVNANTTVLPELSIY